MEKDVDSGPCHKNLNKGLNTPNWNLPTLEAQTTNPTHTSMI
jgi:hypothetical protein